MLNRWQIRRIFGGPGRSGMGIVYVVFDMEAKLAFAAKTFQDEVFRERPDAADLFVEEAHTWIHFDFHPNVTAAAFVEIIGNKPYLFLEYVSGGSLATWIGTPRLTDNLHLVLRFAINFCDGMGHASAKGLKAHRDIKPANCLITADGVLQVTDFGLSSVVGATDRMHGAIGTWEYMAPEQFDDIAKADLRSDVYAFGVMLYEMISGRLPFQGDSFDELKRLHQTREAPALDNGPAALLEILRVCLEKAPSRRFQNFGDLRTQLARVYEKVANERAPIPNAARELTSSDWSNRCASLTALGYAQEGFECSERALELNPRNPGAWINRGAALVENGAAMEAADCFARALELDSTNSVAWFNKGASLRREGKLDEALRCYDRAIEIDFGNVDAWDNKGNILALRGRTSEALDCHRRATCLDPHRDKAWYNCGNSLRALESLHDAIVCYSRAIEINPELIEAWINKGQTLVALRRCDEAMECYDHALALAPDKAVTWYNRANCLRQSGEIGEALASYDRALDLDPNYAQAWSNKGATLVNELRDVDGALPCFQRAFALGDLSAAQAIRVCQDIRSGRT